MELLGGAASAFSVVTLALQSTKVIYEVASTISHGSDDIDRLATATTNLEKLLKVIERLIEHAVDTNNVIEGKLLEEMTPLVDQCANALLGIIPKLVQLQIVPEDRRWKKVKKHARMLLDTKGIAEMWNTVNHYVELLGTFLGNASVDVGLYNAQKLRLLHDELSTASLDIRSQTTHVEKVLRDHSALAHASFHSSQAELHHGSLDAKAAAIAQIQSIAELKTWQQQFGQDFQDLKAMFNDKSDHVTLQSEAVVTKVCDVRDSCSVTTNSAYAQYEEVGRMRAEVMQKLHVISDRLEAVPSMANEQLSTLQGLVEMMSQIQLGIRAGRRDPPKNTKSDIYHTDIIIGRSNGSESTYDPGTEALIARICSSASTMTTHKYSKNAQLVIEDTGRLLGLMMQELSATSPNRDDLPRKRKSLCDNDYSELETEVLLLEDLEKTKRVLTASQRVQMFNQDSRQIDKGDSSGFLFISHPRDSLSDRVRRRRVPNTDVQNIVRSYPLQNGRLDAIFKTMLLPDAEDQDTESVNEAFSAKIVVTPTSASLSNFQIVIDTASRAYHDRTIYFTPTLTFRPMLPTDSEVFRVVEGGSVKKLKKLLNSGAASLGDCDPMGRSLLNFALYKCRRNMTRFLIQSGADVDTLEPRNLEDLNYFGDSNPVKPLDMFERFHDCDRNNENLARVEECYTLLLDAGSDISSVSFSENNWDGEPCWMSAFSNEIIIGSLAKVKALIDLGERFISLESTGDKRTDGTIPLLLLAYNHSQNWVGNYQISDKIALILSRGANVKAKNSRGETCLHLVFLGCCWCNREAKTWQHLSDTKDIFSLMISAGADVCAIDEQGRSVSDAAAQSGQQSIWTEALKYCGIDIRDVLARSRIDSAHSTALSPRYSEPPRTVTSKISLTEYLGRRKISAPGEIGCVGGLYLSSSEDDESENESENESEGEDVAENASTTTEEERNLTKRTQNPTLRTKTIAREKAKLE